MEESLLFCKKLYVLKLKCRALRYSGVNILKVRLAYDASCAVFQPDLFSQYLQGDAEVVVFVMREQALKELLSSS
jgi:hypothetical protein